MRIVNKWNLGLHKFAATGRDIRYALSKVRVAKDYTAATDGRGMVKVDLVEQDGNIPDGVVTALSKPERIAGDDKAEVGFLIDRKLAQRLTTRVSKCLKNPLRKNSTIPGVAYIGADGTEDETRSVFVIPGEDTGTLDTITTVVPTDNYPDVEKVIPKGDPHMTVDLNGKLLGKILSYLGQFADLDCGKVTLSLYKDDEEEGEKKDAEPQDNLNVKIIKLEATNRDTGQNAVAVVMPYSPKEGGE